LRSVIIAVHGRTDARGRLACVQGHRGTVVAHAGFTSHHRGRREHVVL